MRLTAPSVPHSPRYCPVCCFIVPSNVLQRYARDASLPPATRKAMQDTYLETQRLRGLREAHRIATLRDATRFELVAEAAQHQPVQHIFDAKHRKTLPGTPLPAVADGYKTVFDTTAKVIEFYKTVLNRNSVDDKGYDLASTLHYDRNYDNAFWNGQQMVYGDGDGQIFGEMYLSPDVIGHEITHGVTQNESALRYEGESGALNESISDVFGAVFNQWLNGWSASEPKGWLIGAGIMAPPAVAKGKTCLRDMVTPGAAHCLSPQPDTYAKIDPTADVHDNSGVPNRAFALFAQAIGGNAWGDALQVWYEVCTSRKLRSDATFAEFAELTATAAAHRSASLAAKCQAAWGQVGVGPAQD